MIEVAPHCQWCGKPFDTLPQTRIHQKHCLAAPFPRRRHKVRMSPLVTEDTLQLDLFGGASVNIVIPEVFQFVSLILTPAQYLEAMRLADKRDREAKLHGFVGTNNQDPNESLRDNRLGCLGERAYCVWKNLPFSVMDACADRLRPGGKKPADFGIHDVKTTRRHYLKLAVQKDDPIDFIYILALANIGDYRVDLVGWEYGKVFMLPQNFGDHFKKKRPCYAWHKDELQPMSTLPPAFPLSK